MPRVKANKPTVYTVNKLEREIRRMERLLKTADDSWESMRGAWQTEQERNNFLARELIDAQATVTKLANVVRFTSAKGIHDAIIAAFDEQRKRDAKKCPPANPPK